MTGQLLSAPLVVAGEDEDRVVGGRAEQHRGHQGDGEVRDGQRAGRAEQRDDRAGGPHRDPMVSSGIIAVTTDR